MTWASVAARRETRHSSDGFSALVENMELRGRVERGVSLR